MSDKFTKRAIDGFATKNHIRVSLIKKEGGVSPNQVKHMCMYVHVYIEWKMSSVETYYGRDLPMYVQLKRFEPNRILF
jgi:hypothetical protein